MTNNLDLKNLNKLKIYKYYPEEDISRVNYSWKQSTPECVILGYIEVFGRNKFIIFDINIKQVFMINENEIVYD